MDFKLKEKLLRLQFNRDEISRRRKGIALGIVFVILSFSVDFFFPETTFTPPEQVCKPEPQLKVIEGTIKSRGTFYASLLQRKIPIHWIDLIISELKPHVDFNRIKGGTYHFVTDIGGGFVEFLFEKSPTEVYTIEKGLQGYTVQKEEVPLERYLVRAAGQIRSSLFEAMNAIGEEDQLAISLAEILAWEIDFYKDVQEGDRFRVLVEKIYKGDQFIQYGEIHGLEYERGEKIIIGIRYGDGYYDEEGISLRKSFLKSPLRFDRISSKFTGARIHPLLGGVRPHYGVDYAAPVGTPVWAVADGTVVYAGWNGGFGRQVIVRHMNGCQSYYAHLSSYGPGIKRGMPVTQKQTIGYVGSTGLSTGPHLDYRLTRGNRFKDPLEEVFSGGDPIDGGDWKAFQEVKEKTIPLMADMAPSRIKMENIISKALGERS